MTTVETLRRPVAADALKTVLTHEHVFVLDEEMRRNHPELRDESQVFAEAVEKLTGLAELEVSTIVDPTVVGLGRDVARVARVDAHVDINIVVATGLYPLADVPLLFRYHGQGTLLGGEEPMVNMFVKDLTEGIADAGVRAGFLSCAIEESLTPSVERVMRAVARAHLATGMPIVVHTSAPHTADLVAQDVFRGECVDPGALVLDHSGDTDDLNYVPTLIGQGSYVGMDRFGPDPYPPGEKRIANLVRLLDEGLADRRMLSHDASCHIDWFRPGPREQITTMLVDNPHRFLTRGRPS
ncbi:phosphotriesterase family protein [Streptomyces olivochromogenes]|uniref:phosphotriesterase family protein n=1 Tax=Streptomyces olivochromogenes TaxID=1963 RepID=UPI0036AA7316